MRALSKLDVGQSGILIALDLPMLVQNHLMHMGFVPDARVTAIRRAPAGDPTVYLIDGLEIALRADTAKSILVRLMNDSAPEATPSVADTTPELIEAAR